MDTQEFAGKVAIVTGASSGIGFAVAEALALRGANVVATYLSNESGARSLLADTDGHPGQVDILKTDVSRTGDVSALVEHTLERFGGRVDILVNNAGQWMDKVPIAECSEELWDQVMDVNLKSVFLCCRSVIPTMVTRKEGAIVNITSITAFNGGQGGVSVYGAAKGGILGLTRSLAGELCPTIRVNAVAPGVIITDIHRRTTTPERMVQIAEKTPLGRNGDPDECAGAVLLLAGAGGSFITGDVIHVNGGLWIG